MILIYHSILQYTAAHTGIRQMFFLHCTKSDMFTTDYFTRNRAPNHCTCCQLSCIYTSICQLGRSNALCTKMLPAHRF
ncbi:hypothetical protein D3C81_2016590 [compost metagenome]